jgi:hypothetical protein
MELYTIFIGCDDYPFHRLTLCILGSSTVPEFRSPARFALSYGQLLNRVLKMSFQRERPTPPEADLKKSQDASRVDGSENSPVSVMFSCG